MEVFSEVLWTSFITLLFCVAFVRRSPVSIVFACTLIALIAVDPWYSPTSHLISRYFGDEPGYQGLLRGDSAKMRSLHYSWRLTFDALTALAVAYAAKRYWKLGDAERSVIDSTVRADPPRSQLSIRAIFLWITLSAWYVKALQNPGELFETITVVITICLLAIATAHAAKSKSATTVVFLCVALTFFYFPPMGRFRRELVVKLGHFRSNPTRNMAANTILRHGIAMMTSATIAVFGAEFVRRVRRNRFLQLNIVVALLVILYFASYDFLGVARRGLPQPARVFPSQTVAAAYRPAAWTESRWTGQDVWIGADEEFKTATTVQPIGAKNPLRFQRVNP